MEEQSKISFLTVSLVIIFIIVILLTILSTGYNNDTKYKSKMKSKSIVKTAVKENSSKNDSVLTSKIIPIIEYNTYTFEIPNTSKQTAYMIDGTFNNSCLSLYINDTRVHSRIYNDKAHLVLTGNLNISSNLFRLSKNKSYLIPLELNKKYKVVVSNVDNIDIQSYTVNYKIDLQKIVYEYPLSVGTTEYDLESYSRKLIDNIDKRVYPKLSNKFDTWKFSGEGSYMVVYPTNLYNFDININSNIYSTKSVPNKLPNIEIIKIDNPHIEIINKDAKEQKKNIHEEYVEFISIPNNLLNKFLNGSDTKNLSHNKIHDKIIIYKVL